MAKKGNRVQVILECTEHKNSGLPGTSRYITEKNKKEQSGKIGVAQAEPHHEKSDCSQRNKVNVLI